MLCQATGTNMFDGRGNERGSVHRLRQRFWLRLLVWCLFLMEFSRAILGGGGGGGGRGRRRRRRRRRSAPFTVHNTYHTMCVSATAPPVDVLGSIY